MRPDPGGRKEPAGAALMHTSFMFRVQTINAGRMGPPAFNAGGKDDRKSSSPVADRGDFGSRSQGHDRNAVGDGPARSRAGLPPGDDKCTTSGRPPSRFPVVQQN